jgi:signal transduction histidine kinase
VARINMHVNARHTCCSMSYILQLYKKYIFPKSQSEDSARKEFILNILLLPVILMLGVASINNTVRFFGSAFIYQNNILSIWIVYFLFLFFAFLYFLSRRGFFRLASHLLLAPLFLLAAYMGYHWGIDLNSEILLYVLVIIMAGILINTRFALITTGIILLTVIVTGHLQSINIISANRYWRATTFKISDILMLIVMFAIIAIVSWLSNREIERSLIRARKSEGELQKERDLLEIKVEERTKELKKLEGEKIMHLYRFAEFGRLSAGLFHDLINPLNAVSLSIERLKVNDESVDKAMKAAKKMEDLVVAVRKQISRQENKNMFSMANEIQDVVDVLSYKARKNNVEVRFLHEGDINFLGNAIRFNQAVLNLVANAIDSYPPEKSEREKAVEVSLAENNSEIVLSVKDSGAGISRENLQKIFEPFFTTKEYGVGIGLSMAKQIIEKDFLGKLIVESDIQAGQSGSIFTIAIPKSNEC